MKLEHKSQSVAKLPIFFLRVFRYLAFAIGLLIFSVSIGTIGYKYFANLNWINSFYMASMILTGMGPVAEMPTNEAKIFSSFYSLYSGIAFLSITAVFLTPFIHRLLHLLHVEPTKKSD